MEQSGQLSIIRAGDVRIVSSAWDDLALTLRWPFFSNTWARMFSTAFEIKCPLFYQMMERAPLSLSFDSHVLSHLPGGWGRRGFDNVASRCMQRSFVLPLGRFSYPIRYFASLRRPCAPWPHSSVTR